MQSPAVQMELFALRPPPQLAELMPYCPMLRYRVVPGEDMPPISEFAIRYDCIRYGHMIDSHDVRQHTAPYGRIVIIFGHETSCHPTFVPRGPAYHRQIQVA